MKAVIVHLVGGAAKLEMMAHGIHIARLTTVHHTHWLVDLHESSMCNTDMQ